MRLYEVKQEFYKSLAYLQKRFGSDYIEAICDSERSPTLFQQLDVIDLAKNLRVVESTKGFNKLLKGLKAGLTNPQGRHNYHHALLQLRLAAYLKQRDSTLTINFESTVGGRPHDIEVCTFKGTFYLEIKTLKLPTNLLPLDPRLHQIIVDTFFRDVSKRVQVTIRFRRWIKDFDTAKHLMGEVKRLSRARGKRERPFGNVAWIKVEPCPVKLPAPFGQIELPALAHLLSTGDVLPIMMAGDGTKQLIIYPPAEMDLGIAKKLEQKFSEAARQAVVGKVHILVFDLMNIIMAFDRFQEFCREAFGKFPRLSGVVLFNYLPQDIHRPKVIETVLLLNRRAEVPLQADVLSLIGQRVIRI